MATVKILNYELAPSPATIFGCLLPAPWLGMLSGLLLAFGPADGLPQRFAPLSLALTHMLVLGMLAPVMIGALFQLMPVVAGQTVAAARWIAPFVAMGSAATAVCLAAGFLYGKPQAFAAAGVLAVVLFGAVILAFAFTAWRISVTDSTTRTLRWIAMALFAVILCGVSLAGSFAGWWQIDVPRWLNLHVAWGLLGWIAALVAGVASTVVPMFWQTVRPVAWWQRSLPGALYLPLVLALIPAFWDWVLPLSCLLVVTLSAIALRVVSKAKRRFDPAWPLWLACTASWMLAALLTLVQHVAYTYPQSIWLALPVDNFAWWIGVLALIGGAVLPVNAMLGKIIPFLVFLHLRRQIPAGRRVPTMQAVLPPQRLQWQARMVLLALALLLAIPLAPTSFAIAAGIAFAISQAMMGAFLMLALFRYRKELLAAMRKGT